MKENYEMGKKNTRKPKRKMGCIRQEKNGRTLQKIGKNWGTFLVMQAIYHKIIDARLLHLIHTYTLNVWKIKLNASALINSNIPRASRYQSTYIKHKWRAHEWRKGICYDNKFYTSVHVSRKCFFIFHFKKFFNTRIYIK